MRGYEILTTAAARADPERAVAMLAEAATACFAAGKPADMLSAAERAHAALSEDASVRSRFMAETALGMARILGGDAAAGAEAIHRAVALADGTPELKDDLELLPWLTLGPIFLRKTDVGRSALAQALETARERAALGGLPFVLFLLARDHATSDRWAVAEAIYEEAIGMARETDQRTDLGFGLSGLAWLQARRGREEETRALAGEAIRLSAEIGTRLYEVWAAAALGELELGLGNAARAAAHFEDQTPAAPRAWDHRRRSLSCSRARRRLRPARADGRRRGRRGPVHERGGGQGAAVVPGTRTAQRRARGRRR